MKRSNAIWLLGIVGTAVCLGLSGCGPQAAKEKVATDDPAAISAVEKAGRRITRDADGAVVTIDLQQGNVKDFDFAVLQKFPTLTRLELQGTNVKDGAIEKLSGLKCATWRWRTRRSPTRARRSCPYGPSNAQPAALFSYLTDAGAGGCHQASEHRDIAPAVQQFGNVGMEHLGQD